MIKWALLNILLAFTTGIIALLSVSRHKDIDLKPYEKRKVYLAKSIAVYIGIVACLVCLIFFWYNIYRIRKEFIYYAF